MVDVGKFDCRIEVQTDMVGVPDEFNQPTTDWQTVETRWGSCEPLAGREYWQAAQAQSLTPYRVRLRAAGLTITPQQRLRVTTRRGKTLILQIEHAADVRELGEQYELVCKYDPKDQ